MQNSHFNTVLDIQRPRSDERVARDMYKSRISPQFWTSDNHKVTRGMRPRALKFAFHHSFGHPMSTKWWEGCLPPVSTKPTRRKKKKEISKEVLIHSHSQQFSAALLSTAIFSATLLSHSRQLFSAQSFSAALLSAAILSSHSQLSCCCGQRLVVSQLFSSGCCGQGLVVSHSHHVAVVRGWWSTIVTSCCCGQGLVVNYCHIRLLWSGVGGQLLSHHVAMVKGWWLAIVTSCCYGQGLVVSYWHVL